MATGKPAWEVDRDEMSWSSPLLVENNGRAELILTDNKSVCSYNPETGRRFWQVDCLDGEVAPSAAYGGGIVFAAVENSAASAIDIGNHKEEPKILWQWDESLPDSASPVANDAYVVMPTAFGVVTCLDSKSGKVFWEHELNQGFCSSPILVKDRVYITDLSRERCKSSSLEKPSSNLENRTLANPLMPRLNSSGDRIYIRGLHQLFCVGEM